MTIDPGDIRFVTSPCGAHTQPYDGSRGVPVDLGPELRRTLARIKRLFSNLNSGFDGLEFGEIWFPHGAAGDAQIGVFRGHVLDDTDTVARSGSAPDQSWDFDGSSQFYQCNTKPTQWTLSYLESWSLHVAFDADRFPHSSREVLFSINDDDDKPFLLHLEDSGAGDNASALVATITDNGGTERDLAWSGSVANDTDYYVSLYFDAANDILAMSVNGGAFETLDTSGYTLPAAGANPVVTVGAGTDSNGDAELFFDGEICIGGQPLVFLPRTVLSRTQANFLYNGGDGRTIEGSLPLSQQQLFKYVRHVGLGDIFTADATSDILTSDTDPHGLSRGSRVFLRTSSAIPGGLDVNVQYYVIGTAFTADAGTDVVTSTAHGLSDTDEIYLDSTGTLPAGMVATMFVRDSTTDTFKVALTEGGAAVNITDAGTGTHYWLKSDEFKVSLEADGTQVNVTGAGTGTHKFAIVGQQDDLVADDPVDVLYLEEGDGITLTYDQDNDRVILIWNVVEAIVTLLANLTQENIETMLALLTGYSDTGDYILILSDDTWTWTEYVAPSWDLSADSGTTRTVDVGEDVEFIGDTNWITTVVSADTDDHDLTIKHLQPYTETTAADTSTVHTIEDLQLGICYMQFDDAGHFMGIWVNGSWVSPWSFSDPAP